jgi:hypothetical protein
MSDLFVNILLGCLVLLNNSIIKIKFSTSRTKLAASQKTLSIMFLNYLEFNDFEKDVPLNKTI